MYCRIKHCEECGNDDWLCTRCAKDYRLVNYPSRYGDVYQVCQTKMLYCLETDPVTQECISCQKGTELLVGSDGSACKNVITRAFQVGLIFFLAILAVSIAGLLYVFVSHWINKRKKRMLADKAKQNSFQHLSKDSDKGSNGKPGRPSPVILPNYGEGREQMVSADLGSGYISQDNSPHHNPSFTGFDHAKFPGGAMDTPVKQYAPRPSKPNAGNISRPNLLMLYSANDGPQRPKNN